MTELKKILLFVLLCHFPIEYLAQKIEINHNTTLLYFPESKDISHINSLFFKRININFENNVLDSVIIYRNNKIVFSTNTKISNKGGRIIASYQLKVKKKAKLSYIDVVLFDKGVSTRIYLDSRFKNIEISPGKDELYVLYRNQMVIYQ